VTITYAIAMSAAASVEGRMKMCSSASARLVRVTLGSTHTMRRAVLLRQPEIFQRAGAEGAVARAQPHITMSRELT